MLSRTAANLYWIGRYMERAEFTTRLIEATLRLSSLSYGADATNATWESALAVVGRGPAPGDTAAPGATAFNVCKALALDLDNPNSIRSCLSRARDNARSARNALSSEVWAAINRAWLDVGDRILFMLAGAYTVEYGSHFNGFSPPAVVTLQPPSATSAGPAVAAARVPSPRSAPSRMSDW